MVTANRKSTIDAHKKKNESKHNTEASHQSTREEKQRKGKDLQKQIQNN